MNPIYADPKQSAFCLGPYLKLLTRNDLLERIGGIFRMYRTTPMEADALWHFRESSELIAEFRKETKNLQS